MHSSFSKVHKAVSIRKFVLYFSVLLSFFFLLLYFKLPNNMITFTSQACREMHATLQRSILTCVHYSQSAEIPNNVCE